MNKIDFTQPGGLPLTQDALNFLQKAYAETFGGMAKVLGDKVILWGCAKNANNVIQPGMVSLNGEILYTPGGSATVTTVYIQEAARSVRFKDGSDKAVYKTRTLEFGIGNPQWNWADFKPNPIPALADELAAHKEDKDNPHELRFKQLFEQTSAPPNMVWQLPSASRIILHDPGSDTEYHITLELLAYYLSITGGYAKIRGSATHYDGYSGWGSLAGSLTRTGVGEYKLTLAGQCNGLVFGNAYMSNGSQAYVSIVRSGDEIWIRTADDSSRNDAYFEILNFAWGLL